MKHACPDWSAEAVYGLPEMQPRDDPRRAPRGQSRAAIRPRCSSASCRCSRRASSTVAPDRRRQVRRDRRRPQGRSRTSCSPKPSDNFKAYGVAGHRHLPGDSSGPAQAGAAAGRLDLRAASDADDPRHPRHALCARSTPRGRSCRRCTRSATPSEPFVDVMPAGQPCRTHARCAARTSAASRCTGRRTATPLVVLSVIDNLVKGAAGQAVQNMNIMFGLAGNHGPDGRFRCCRDGSVPLPEIAPGPPAASASRAPRMTVRTHCAWYWRWLVLGLRAGVGHRAWACGATISDGLRRVRPQGGREQIADAAAWRSPSCSGELRACGPRRRMRASRDRSEGGAGAARERRCRAAGRERAG